MNGVERESLLDLLHITENYLYRLERGHIQRPSVDLMLSIRDLFNIPVDALIFTESAPDPPGEEAEPKHFWGTITAHARLKKLEKENAKLTKLLLQTKQEANHRMIVSEFQLQYEEILRSKSLPEKEKQSRIKRLAVEAVSQGVLQYWEARLITGLPNADLRKGLEAKKRFFECKTAENGGIIASNPGEAGARLYCADCDENRADNCEGHGIELYPHPRNIFVLLDRLERHGVTRFEDAAKILKEDYAIELTARELTLYASNYRKGKKIPEYILYLDPNRED
jgi:transcriptional regulator with XRE-family HTH domain